MSWIYDKTIAQSPLRLSLCAKLLTRGKEAIQDLPSWLFAKPLRQLTATEKPFSPSSHPDVGLLTDHTCPSLATCYVDSGNGRTIDTNRSCSVESAHATTATLRISKCVYAFKPSATGEKWASGKVPSAMEDITSPAGRAGDVQDVCLESHPSGPANIH